LSALVSGRTSPAADRPKKSLVSNKQIERMGDFGCAPILFFRFTPDKIFSVKNLRLKHSVTTVIRRQKQKWQGRRVPSLPLWLII
jgi:hypothetical protein